MNLLITAIGSFSAETVVNSFRKNNTDKIYGCDIFPAEWHHISEKFDNVFQAPLVKNETDYLDFILNVCEHYKIKTIIPLTDIEVDFFNKKRDLFNKNGIIVTIANSDFLKVARDKENLSEFCGTVKGVSPIPTYSESEITSYLIYPLIAKPKDGRSSEGIFFLNKREDLALNADNKNYIFQQVIKGKICTVDYVRSAYTGNDFCIPRWEHLRTKNGAGMTVETFKDEKINNILHEIGKRLNINGCTNMEFIVDNGKYYLIDINPRFSAGIGFSHLAGYDFVQSHIRCFMGDDILPAVSYKTIIAEKIMTEVINKEV